MLRLKRSHLVILLVLLGIPGLVFLSRRAERSGQPQWYESAAHRVIGPVAERLSGGLDWLRGLSSQYLELRGAKSQNVLLAAREQELQSELTRLREENRALKAQAGLYAESGLSRAEARPARVIGYDPAALHRSIVIDRGSEDGIAPDQAVVSGGAVIGRVLKAGARSSQVLLLTDLNSAVDVLDARTRARGVLVGLRRELGLKRERWLTQAEYVSAGEEIRPGDLLLSSGLDGVFPKGLPVGVVSQVKKDATGLFWQAEVEPYAELNKLEEVLVLEKREGDG
ncbi:MAG: rod shape-determining protein MreC [bacterium]